MPKITPEQRQQARLSILRLTTNALSASILRAYLRSEGFVLDKSDVELEILYLMDKGFLAKVNKEISPEIPNFRVTASGRDYLATNGQE
jgi:FlaG/FlaF family flagellin (archaellin)